jgi:hypothetical protein
MNQVDNFANDELEKVVLASLLNGANGEVPALDLFFFEVNRTIYKGFAELEARNVPPDIVTLTQILRETGQLDLAGGAHAVTTLGTDYKKPPEITEHAVGELRALRAQRQTKDLGEQMLEGSIGPEAVRNRLEGIINSIDPFTGLCVRSAKDILGIKLDPNDCLLGDRLLSKSGKLVIAGQAGIGKSRLLLQLAAASDSGKPWCGIETHARGLRWLILQTENSNRRLQLDLRALEHQYGSEFLEHVFIRTIEGEELLSLSNSASIESVIRKIQPDIIAWDPLRDFGIGNLDSDEGMTATVLAIGKLCRRGNPNRAIVILHHAITGKVGAAKFIGWERSGFARNSKVLLSWARAQINVAPGNPDNNDTLVMLCGKNNDGKEFSPFAVNLDPDAMIYEMDDSFDLDEWREQIGADKRPDRSIKIPALLESGPLKKADLAKVAKAELKCSQSGAYKLIDKADERGLIKLNRKTDMYETA